MRFSKNILFVGLLSFSALAQQLADLDSRFSIKLVPGLKAKEIYFLSSDFRTLESYEFDIESGSTFDSMFNGTSPRAVLNYLDERINYIIPADENTSRTFKAQGASKDAPVIHMGARNLGSFIWAKSVGLGQSWSARIGNEVVSLNSPRVGIIQLGEGYAMESKNYVRRLTTLVHEARHSDCTGGISQNEADAFAGKIETSPSGYVCLHAHSVCPAGHSYAGLGACDAHAWGAYSVGAIYDAALAYRCTNCSETTKQLAKALVMDNLSRVQVDLQAMLSGSLGQPDMSSETSLRN